MLAPLPLLDALRQANWVAVDDQLRRLGRSRADLTMLGDAIIAVCHHDYAKQANLSSQERIDLMRKLGTTLQRLSGASGNAFFFSPQQAEEALKEAVVSEDPKLVDALLALGARPTSSLARPRQSLGPMIYAMGLGNIEILEKLIDHGGNLHETDLDGCSGLTYAAAGNHQSMLRCLVGKGISPNRRDHRGRTCLMSELGQMQSTTVETLVELGASVFARDHEGRSVQAYANASHVPAARVLESLIQLKKLANPVANPAHSRLRARL